jgi:hypothetical protein
MTRTNKHQSKRTHNAAPVQDKDISELLLTAKEVRLLYNALIEKGEATLDRCVYGLQKIHDSFGDTKTIVACAHCAARIGIKRCARCSKASTIRYCSRECQLAAWPAHKAICRVSPCAL